MSRSLLKKLSIILFFLVLTPLFFTFVHQLKLRLGLAKLPVPVVGTGSMYPSLFWSKEEGGPEDPSTTNLYPFRTEPLMYRYLPQLSLGNWRIRLRDIGHGDIVSFHNAETAALLKHEGQDPHAGFIKRVIALPGDTLEIRDGYVYLNGRLLSEPYIYKPRSTYGQSFLPDCQPLTIPSGKLFVMGDNRKISSDSRGELGLVDFDHIDFILPYDEQTLYHDFWRDPSHDADLAQQPTLDVSHFYRAVNQLRSRAKLNPLRPNSKLERSAHLRAQAILASNDFSVEATLSGYPLSRALKDASYHNPLTGEFVIRGYYDVQELVSSLNYSPAFKKQLLDSRYQDIGLAVVNGEVNQCPTQVIVGHLGGYIPAHYDQETLSSWRTLIDNLDQAIPSWEQARQFPDIDQAKLQRLLQILSRRRQIAQEIYQTMTQKQWLTPAQEQLIQEDRRLAQEADILISQLNQHNE